MYVNYLLDENRKAGETLQQRNKRMIDEMTGIISEYLESNYRLRVYNKLIPSARQLIQTFSSKSIADIPYVPQPENFIEIMTVTENIERADLIMSLANMEDRAYFINSLLNLVQQLNAVIRHEPNNVAKQMIKDGALDTISTNLIEAMKKYSDKYFFLAYEWTKTMVMRPFGSPMVDCPAPLPEDYFDPDQVQQKPRGQTYASVVRTPTRGQRREE